MRPDLTNYKLYYDHPSTSVEAAAAAFIWMSGQLYKDGFLESKLTYAELNSSGRYVHSGFFVNNSTWFTTAWNVCRDLDYFDYSLFTEGMHYTRTSKVEEEDNTVTEVFIRLYLNTLRQVISLGIDYGKMYSDPNKIKFDKKAFLEDVKFNITSENPFIEMIDYLVRGHNHIAMMLAFLATAPNGAVSPLITALNAERIYYVAVPHNNLNEFRPRLFNQIPNKDWMALGT